MNQKKSPGYYCGYLMCLVFCGSLCAVFIAVVVKLILWMFS